MAALTARVWVSAESPGIPDHGFKVEITEASGMPSEVFVWQRAPALRDGSPGRDMFVGVAQPADLHDIPAGSPDNPENPYYRTHDVELWFGSADDFTRYLTLVQDHIRDLVRRVNALNGLEPQSETVFGYPEAEASAMSLFHCPRCPFAVKDFVRICPTCPFVEAVRAKQAGT